jgi:predicted DNA-binding WGR domain protein
MRALYHAGYYEYKKNGSNKFWECLLTDNNQYRVRWGRIGTKGQHMYVSYYEADKRINEKKAKGYVLVDGTSTLIEKEKILITKAIDNNTVSDSTTTIAKTKKVRI